MLRDTVKKYYDKEYDYNCAETILYASNEEYNLGLGKDTFKTMAGFGGGMAIESVCGAFTGAISVLGILFTEDRAHESDKMKTLVSELMGNFHERMGTYQCNELKAKYRNDDIRCSIILETAADVLDEIIQRELKNK